uniref:Uncharacterized protein n=1 Tax=Zooxanthella nutricula TaxID=1333877 RepID=A0A6U6MVC0_9DINO
MPKKRVVRKENNLKKLIDDEKANEQKLADRKKKREELRSERRAELVEKLQAISEAAPSPVTATGAAGAAGAAGGGDFEMRAAGRAAKQGVLRKIGKDKSKTRANKALLKQAQKQGVIYDVAAAKRLLEGRKPKRQTTPNGRERKRDQKLRKAREKRERKCPTKPKDGDSDDS